LRNIVLLILLLLSTTEVLAQQDTADNYVQRFMTIPSIEVHIVPDSAIFTNDNIVKGSSFVLMFFNPDCDHCQTETKEILDHKDQFQATQILMVSALPYTQIKFFYDSFKLSSMPSIKMGQDINSRLGSIYHLKIFPSVFVYDKKGDLAKAFVGKVGVQAIVEALQ